MDLEFKVSSLESFFSPSQHALSPIWQEKDKPDDDAENANSDGDDQGSMQETDVENGDDHACSESVNDALEWENGIGTLVGSDLKFRMNEHGDIEVITDSLDMENIDASCGHTDDDNLMIDESETGPISTTSQQISSDSSLETGILPVKKEETSQDTHEDSHQQSDNPGLDSNFSFFQPEREINEEEEPKVQEQTERTESPHSDTKDELNPTGLEDNMPELDPVLSEDMSAILNGGSTSMHEKDEPIETDCIHESILSTEDFKAEIDETPKRSACIICGRPATLANRFCSRQCIGKNAARQRRANHLAISKKTKGGKKPLGKKHYDYSSPHPNDVLTVVHDDTPGSRNDLKIKIRWSSSISNEKHDQDYAPELKETSKRRAAIAAGNYAYAGYIRGARRKRFSWLPYLAQENAVAAPPKAFQEVTGKDPFPSPNGFEIGMALEGVDPEHEALICPLFVAEIRGSRIRLSFCGYSGSHDFWRDVDSHLIFPCGFCKETNRVLQPPKECSEHNFDWENYLKRHRLTKAPHYLFSPRCDDTDKKFKVGKKLEAVDKHNPSLLCVATIQDVLGDHLLIHFDGWSHNFDYWCSSNSTYIHPAGWCLENNKELSPPLGYNEKKRFTWDSYLNITKSEVEDASLFPRKIAKHSFEVGMRLEVVDPRNKILVRVATINEIKEFQVKIHFDGWSDMYDFWTHLEDTDLHPVGWCEKTGHPLEPPVSLDENSGKPQSGGCPIPGCRGIGHIHGAKFQNHYSEFGCPYSPQNLAKEPIKDRLSPIKSRRSTQAKEEDDFYIDEGEDFDFFDANFNSKGAKVSRKRNGSYYNPPSPTPVRKRTRGRPEVNRRTFQNTAGLLHNVEIVAEWGAGDVAKFVEEVTNDPSYGKIFAREEIDGKAMLMLSQADILTVLRIKLGPAVKICNAIMAIKESQ